MSRLFGISDENPILIIMSWLDLRDHGLLDLALTNAVERKRWMICLSSAHLNSNLRAIQYTPANPKYNLSKVRCAHSLLRWLITRKMQLEVISYSLYAVIDDRSFIGIDNKLLHTLGLYSSDITDDGLLMIALGCPQLKDITLIGCRNISDTGLSALAVNLPGMTSIDLWLTFNMTHVGVSAIAKRCPALMKFSLDKGDRFTSNSFELNDSIRAIARGCPKLQTIIILQGDWLSDSSLTFLAGRCKELRSVCLHECELVTDEAIRAIATSCPDLEKLDIAGKLFTSEIRDQSFAVVGRECSKLAYISITNNIVSDIGIAALARGCPQLRSFSAHHCPSISTAGITALTHGRRELRTIDLQDCQLITDGCLFSIAEGCPELTSFCLFSCEAVTNAGISCIARGCEKLTSITIRYCSQIDDTALIAIGSSCPNLLGITIAASTYSNTPKISDRGLIAVACCCPALESIIISHFPNITDAGVIVLAQKCFQLKSISLAMSKITDASLIAFATNSRKLQSVSFSLCDSITSSGLSILAAECAQMQEIDLFMNFKVGKENLLSLRRKYLLAKTSEHNRPTSVLSMPWNIIS